MVAFVVSSIGFDNPKEKPPAVGLLSVLKAPVPNTIPSLAPNLNPEPLTAGSDLLSSVAGVRVEAAPNLKPSDEPPNLNPDEPLVSLEMVSDEELPNEPPNLKPPVDEDEVESERVPPNLNPSEPEVESDDEPNLNPPAPEAGVPNTELEVPDVDEPKAEHEKQGIRSFFSQNNINCCNIKGI